MTNVVMSSFVGEDTYLKVARKEGMEDVNLLSEDEEEASEEKGSIWSSLFGKDEEKAKDKKDKAVVKKEEATLNVFSLASGLVALKPSPPLSLCQPRPLPPTARLLSLHRTLPCHESSPNSELG